jgi:hypothetical protein
VVASAIVSYAAAVYSVNSASIKQDVSSAVSNGESWVSSNSASLQGDLSTLSTFVASNSASLRNDLSSAQIYISGLKSTLTSIEATITPPPNPFGRRATVTVDQTSIEAAASSVLSDLESIATALVPIVATITPPPNPFVARRNTIIVDVSSFDEALSDLQESAAAFGSTVVKPASSIIANGINDGINVLSSAKPVVSNLAETLATLEATYSPPTVVFDKRSVIVLSQDLTCHGQAAVTLTASNAASLIASATSVAKGTRFYADGLSGTAAPTATSTSTGGAAMITRGPMLCGAAVAILFAAL